MEDRQWVREIQNGKKEYLQNIAEKYYDDIYRFCCYRTGNPEISYDLAQETFCRFIRYVENYRYRNLKGYLLTIAMNVCKDYYAGSKKRLEHEEMWEEDLDRQLVLQETGPEGSALGADRSARLLHLLGCLPTMQREAIILHYYCDMRFREIGRLTGVNTATAKSRVKQGMEKLRKLCRKEDFDESI